MKKILFFLFISTASYSQGIQAGWTSVKGFHVGIFGKYQFMKGSTGYFVPGAMLNNKPVKVFDRVDISDNGEILQRHYKYQSSYSIQFPLLIQGHSKKGDLRPFFTIGGAPTFGLSNSAHNVDFSAIFGLGVSYNKFFLESRYDAGLKGINDKTNVKNFMVSAGYYFK